MRPLRLRFLSTRLHDVDLTIFLLLRRVVYYLSIDPPMQGTSRSASTCDTRRPAFRSLRQHCAFLRELITDPLKSDIRTGSERSCFYR